jgi:penicillin-binding protein-related factor A (putative recombinase)
VSTSNSGKWLEKLLDETHKAYGEQGRAKLHKVGPPTQMLGRGKMKLLPSCFLDFTGAWTEAGGQALQIEAKSTTDRAVLRIRNEGGIKEAQYQHLIDWHNAGAAVGVLWGRNEIDEVRLIPITQLHAIVDSGVLNIKWDQVAKLPHAPGVRWDYLTQLRDHYPWQ